MLYDNMESDSKIVEKIRGINNWIEENRSHIGNANMYEIASSALAINNIADMNLDVSSSTDELGRMIGLRGNSIKEFLEDVPEASELFNKVVFKGLTYSNNEEMEFICKSLSVPFFINNTRKRGFDGDITMGEAAQASRAIPGFQHDNKGEVEFLVKAYENASDEVKKASFPIVNWVINNSVDEIRMVSSINPVEKGHSK